jgi:predicted nucleic acid-binding Zn finger protein
MLKPKKRELTKNGRSVSTQLTQSEYEEWVKLGKSKWLRSFLKDSRFERKANGNDTGSKS